MMYNKYPDIFHNNPHHHDVPDVTMKELATKTHYIAFVGQKPNPNRSLFIFSENNLIRKTAKTITEYKFFEYMVIFTISLNCISLAMEVHLPVEDKIELNIKMAVLEPIFLGIFTAECVIKIVALGFIWNKGSYLRSIWNILDFIVVAAGLATANISSNTNIDLRTFRAIRVLRPLKLVSGIPSLQVVLSSIIKAMAPLLQIGLLVLFAIIIFAIIGLELYRGDLHFTCFKDSDPRIQQATKEPCVPLAPGSCQPNYTCRPYWEGPFYGIISFDNIGYSMLTVFQCITMEGWTDIMYIMNKATGSQLNALYFVSLIILGSFFMLNLVLGVLSGEFAKERERVEKRTQYLQMREQQRNQQMLEGYLSWIETAEELALATEDDNEPDNSKPKWKFWKKQQQYDAQNNRSKKSENWKTLFCCGTCLRELRLIVRHLTKTQVFYWTVIVIVFLNTICVAMEHYNQPPFLDKFLFYTDYVFLTMFFMEMLLKMFGVGFKEYFRSKFNIFDFFVVMMSAFEVIFQIFFPEQQFGFSALRCIRLLRLLKLTRYWPSLRNLVLSLLSSMRSILSLLMLLALFIFILTLLGMQLFGGDFNFDKGTPTLNFDTFVQALITVFVILTGENWNEIMYDGIRSQRKGNTNGEEMFYSIYFLLIVLLGNYTLLNVFLAIAVDNLANAAELSAAEEEEREEQAKRMEEKENEELQKLLGGPVIVPELDLLGESANDDEIGLTKPMTLREELSQTCGITLEEEDSEDPTLGKKMLPYSSLFIFAPNNILRKFCHFLVNLKHFDLFIMMVIFASSIALAAEDPICSNSRKNSFLEKLDYAFTGVFLIEMILKVIDMGLMFHPGSYVRDLWNFMDMFVVFISMFSIIYSQSTGSGESAARDLNTIKSLRVIRVLRPLKTINRIPKLKAVFDTIINSIKNVFNILIVFILFQFIFAVVAVQLFNGKFFFCNDISKRTINTCQGYFINYDVTTWETTVLKRQWQKYCFHYDNIFYSMTTLFTVTTGEGWPTVLEHSMFATKINEGPIRYYRPQMAIFYIVFFIVFPFFFVNIFVALIIITFQEQGEADLSNSDIDKNKSKCIDFSVNVKPVSTFMPEDKTSICYKMWLLVLSPPFETFIMILIALNSITLVLKSHTKPPGPNSAANERVIGSLVSQTNLGLALKYLNIAFTLLFTLECIFKLIAFQFKYYFKDPWNVFDLFTVVGSILDVVMVEIKSEDMLQPFYLESNADFPNLGFLRLFRALRLVKVLRQGYSIRILLWTFIQSFKSLPWVVLLMALLFFIYCIIGMQVFGNIKFNDSSQINENNNFRTFIMGILLLFRCATGESWHQIMMDTDSGKECQQCDVTAPSKNDCGHDFAYPFFISFILFTTFLMLNLFVAVIMDNFDYLTRDSSILGPHHLDEFVRVWALYDPLATGKIHYQDMYKLVRRLDPPLGLGMNCPYRAAYMKLIRMNMVMDEDKQVQFNSTIFSLIRESLQIKMGPADEMDNLDQELRVMMLRTWPSLKKKGRINDFVPQNRSSNKLTVGKVFAGLLIRDNWLNYKKWLKKHPKGREELLALTAQQTALQKKVESDDGSDIDEYDGGLRRRKKKKIFDGEPIKYNPRSDDWEDHDKVKPPDYTERGIELSAELFGRVGAMIHRPIRSLNSDRRIYNGLPLAARNSTTSRRTTSSVAGAGDFNDNDDQIELVDRDISSPDINNNNNNNPANYSTANNDGFSNMFSGIMTRMQEFLHEVNPVNRISSPVNNTTTNQQQQTQQQ